MDKLVKKIIAKAITCKKKKVVFPEVTDKRILQACKKIHRKKISECILIGQEKKILPLLKKYNIPRSAVTIIDQLTEKNREHYAKKLYKIRKKKGMTPDQALKLMDDPLYYGCMMVHENDADGLIAGATWPTSKTLLPAFQIINEKHHRISSSFIMVIEGRYYVFADCAVNPSPTPLELACIAECSAETYSTLVGPKPKVAMLAFSTKGSSNRPEIEPIRQATKIAKRKWPKLVIDGEIQLDAAIIPFIAKVKGAYDTLKGQANVLIFPNLNCGNIAYKLIERLAHAQAVGPIMQGLEKPINDLSRGCSANDIMIVTAITVLQANKVRMR